MSDEGTGSEEFEWDSAMSQLAQTLEQELGPGYSLVPEYRVTLLCQEFWRNHMNWTLLEARRRCEDKLRADVSVGVQVTRLDPLGFSVHCSSDFSSPREERLLDG